jgi:hypothetical protein
MGEQQVILMARLGVGKILMVVVVGLSLSILSTLGPMLAGKSLP